MATETRHYKCWKSSCVKKSIRGNSADWYTEEQLTKRKEDTDHTDYCCPDCESVIICVKIK